MPAAWGTVFLGRDPNLKRLVAIKALKPEIAGDESSRLRFERDAGAPARWVPRLVWRASEWTTRRSDR